MTDFTPAEIADLIEAQGREGRRQIFEGEFPDKLEKLCQAFALAHSARVKQVLCNIFASLARPEALPCLLNALDDPAPEVVAAAEDAIGNSAADYDIQDPLRTMLGNRLLQLVSTSSAREPIQSAGIYALGLLRFHESLPALLSLLDDPLPIIRRNAAEALSHIGDCLALASLIARYHYESEPGVKRYLKLAIATLENVEGKTKPTKPAYP